MQTIHQHFPTLPLISSLLNFAANFAQTLSKMFSIFFGTPHLFIFLLARLLRPAFTRSESRSVPLVHGMCYPALPPQGKTGGLARSRGFHARTMDTTRPPSKPSTLLARHVVRKRNFLGAFAKLRETDATRIHHTECGYIRLRKPRNKTRHVSRFLSFVHYGRSSVSRIQSPNRKSSASVGNRGSSKSTLSLELLSLIYISHIFLRILSPTINNFSRQTYQIAYLCAYLYR